MVARIALILLAASLAAAAALPAAGGLASGGGAAGESASGTGAVRGEGAAGAAASPAREYRLHAEPYYFEAAAEWEREHLDASVSLTVSGADYAAASGDAEVRAAPFEGKPDALLWTNQEGWVEYEIDVPEAGLYVMELEYYPLRGAHGASRAPLTLSVELNGAVPFREARSLEFEREFADAWPLEQDLDGNDIRPKTVELERWKTKAVHDSEGAYPLPLKWYLSEGKNTLRLTKLREPAALGAITFRPPEPLPDYRAYRSSLPADALTNGRRAGTITLEAERMALKNATSIQVRYDRDAATTPLSQSRITYNTVGGWRWFEGGESAAWTFEVPETGLYRIAMRVKQNFRSNMSVFRTIAVDGRIPFAELAPYAFPYDRKWQGVTLGGEEDPYLFYLEKGTHTLTMTASNAPYRSVLARLEEVSGLLHETSRMVAAARGGAADEWRVWRVEEEIPGLTGRLRSAREMLNAMTETMLDINGRKDHVSQTLESVSGSLASLLSQPNGIPNRLDQLISLRESLESLHSFLVDSPLEIDKWYVIPEGEPAPRMSAGWFRRLLNSFEAFFASFAPRDRIDVKDEDVLNVWMLWGRDHVNELQLLANERFTPEFGVRVKVNLVRQPDLLVLAASSGSLPDVALGVPGNMPFDLALRGAAHDLARLDGADERIAQYHPGMLLPFRYDGGVYALPETVLFKVLFYRKDILGELGLAVPDTWDDVYEMLPALLQNRYNFYIDPKDFATLFHQLGAPLYEPGGLKSALHDPKAYDAFKAWTDLFQVYGLEKSVQSFYNQFRRGYLPIGIADFNQFLQLTVAAPELRGLWDIAPIPGTRGEDGSVERWSGGVADGSQGGGASMTAVMMFGGDAKKRELAWEFVKWYTSAEIQTEFGLNLESFNGEQFRWNTANVEAFARMPWKPDQLEVLLEQWRWYKDLPMVPGGYMTARELQFAWIRTVIDGETPRAALEDAVREIDRELLRKQLEFGFAEADGTVRKALDVPDVDRPWTGGMPDAR